MPQAETYEPKFGRAVFTANPTGVSPVVLVCEHASKFIPETYQGLGLTLQAQDSHVAWDPGAYAIAAHLSHMLEAQLIQGGVSRLIYDCNRPPDAPDAMPQKSEIYEIPGNANLDDAEKLKRVATYYAPFRRALAKAINRVSEPVLITVHSFTPIYMGHARTVDIGILTDTDTRLADAMLATATAHTPLRVKRNQPYGPGDGVTHTLKEHALSHGHLNVMLEIRNDIIETLEQQARIAAILAGWLTHALNNLGVDLAAKDSACQN